jgi:nitroimidazol reductase NimA-like FMN-containing flavoprotein (pyridoxamine 5'-phosphate oxidase superfamily)
MKPMRRSDKQLKIEQAETILRQNKFGVLSLVLPDGTPYGVPVNYGYSENQIIIHAAQEGTKLEAIQQNPHACFTVIHQVVIDAPHLNTEYASTIAFGRITLVTDPAEKRRYLIRLLSHFGVRESQAKENLKTEIDITSVLVLTIDSLTAKGNADFVKLK